MIGEDEERNARRLGDVLRAALPCEVHVEGKGVHWNVTVAHGDREGRVACFWCAPAGPGTRVPEPGGAVVRQGAEYLVHLCEGGQAIAEGRVDDPDAVAGCLRAWLLERRALAGLVGPWPFSDRELRERRRLADLIELALVRPGPVRVVVEHELGVELWVYGEDRSCRVDPGPDATTGCTFLIGPSPVATASLAESVLAPAVAAWTQDRVTLAELTRRVPGLDVSRHAELLERGDAARWHWANVVDAAADGDYPLCEFADLLARVVVRPAIGRFFSFTSVNALCFSYSSNYPFLRDGLPTITPRSDGRFRLECAGDRWIGDVDETIVRLEEILVHAPHPPFRGSATHSAVVLANAELARQGSPLRAELVQRRQWFDARVARDRRACTIDVDGRWFLRFFEDGVRVKQEDHRRPDAAIAAVRSWLEPPAG